MIKLFLSGA